MIDIEKRDALPGGWWFLTLCGEPVVAAACLDVCRRYAKILSQAANAPFRDAMRLLTADIGLCEAAARELYLKLQSRPAEKRAVN